MYRCSRSEKGGCGWSGVAQDQRAGCPSILVEGKWVENPEASKLAWSDKPWCPRCGAPAVPLEDVLPASVVLVEGPDTGSGLQPEERPVVDLEARVATLERVVAELQARLPAKG